MVSHGPWILSLLANCFLKEKKKRFCLGLREVNLNPEKDEIIFKEGLVDGNNVRETYRIVKLGQVCTVEFRINY